MSQRVIAAQMHDGIWVPGIGLIKKEIDAKSFPGLQMTLGVYGVDATLKGVSFLIPLVNFKAIVFEPLDK